MPLKRAEGAVEIELREIAIPQDRLRLRFFSISRGTNPGRREPNGLSEEGRVFGVAQSLVTDLDG